jgi:serine O-acetyltransferase
MKALSQLRFLWAETRMVVNRRPWRWLTIWFGSGIWVNVSYRFDRFLYLLLGESYVVLRPLCMPFFLVCAFLGGRHEIGYRADIGKGLKVLHTALGIVVSGKTVAGERLTLTGGNLIGGRRPLKHGDIVIGSGVSLGANAVVLGPVRVGSQAQIGAGAVVIRDVADGAVVVGVPAREVKRLLG